MLARRGDRRCGLGVGGRAVTADCGVQRGRWAGVAGELLMWPVANVSSTYLLASDGPLLRRFGCSPPSVY